ncbi:MAG: TetR/AcrR family transcriptional regulator [Sandaracinaceae bacterium]|nr:TetR/AcrR family transcriptional regulator [Sandaracinaceae bacterium]
MSGLLRTKIPKERPGPEGGKRDRNRRERSAALINAGLDLFLEFGIEQTSIDDIAKNASMAKGNFYRYFDDKASLVELIIAPLAQELRLAFHRCEEKLRAANTPEALAAAYSELSLTFGILSAQRPKALRLYLQEKRAPQSPSRGAIHRLASEIEESAMRLSRYAVEGGLVRVGDHRVGVLFVIGAAEQLTLSRLNGAIDADDATVVRVVVQMMLEGIIRRDLDIESALGSAG